MRVDFYQLSRDPAPVAIALLARKTIEAGERLLVVADDLDMLESISKTLWEASPEAFLANGIAGDEHDARQPILLSGEVDPANSAKFLLLADGEWRDPGDTFTRTMLLFDAATIEAARQTWKALGERNEIERKFWKQDGGRWVEGP
ncbi:DNA polymerase III subunit chi [Aurantiacibacter aquimixticola]|uniref:DNA polymerase III subunit chi n=1 Tax=Aurantiacibacter aquimixticola TaxID=1958945 RepID=A0A419RQU8_9SPHN|nr:DNA polymerase III subunit chi [Aurantiacibacter aquimixticola]RJY08144.1 DNA polymerase III subunit chi [Aurantiacibacter aquimixticola]